MTKETKLKIDTLTSENAERISTLTREYNFKLDLLTKEKNLKIETMTREANDKRPDFFSLLLLAVPLAVPLVGLITNADMHLRALEKVNSLSPRDESKRLRTSV